MDPATILALAASMALVPRKDAMEAAAVEAAKRAGFDEQLAPIWGEKLRFNYTQVQEIEYADLAAEHGDVLPIDTSVPPHATEWSYTVIDHHGHADWIDDDGDVMPNSAMTTKRFTGTCHEIGHRWDVNFFDLERAAAADLPIETTKRNASRRYHAEMTNWVWLFGDPEKELPGLVTHPNITQTLAPLNAGAASRLWANKSNEEIAADVAILIDSIPVVTVRKHYATKVFLPLQLVQLMRNRTVGSGDGTRFTSLWDQIKERYKGDDTGQGKVEFRVLNECSAAWRSNPKTQTDSSGIDGDFIIALPNATKDDLAFIRARPFTSRPPQEDGFKVKNPTHSKVGGCKNKVPLACHVMRFGTT